VDLTLEPATIAYALLLALVAAALIGLLPALKATARPSSGDCRGSRAPAER
jgi:ABC-type antimicrobial peptide transport system permease subunit